ncbi:MAG TPA: hypothetical protein VF275_04735 [Gammaproteobacteria bacterium]
MHPIIRILCLLVLAALTPWLPREPLLALGALLLAWGIARPETGRVMRYSVKRIRWLLLSLVILYLWFSPGAPLLPALGPLSPTAAGIQLAAHRAGVLLVLVFAASAFLGDVPPRHVTSALRRMLSWPVETRLAMRFADRVGLLLAELPAVEQRARVALKNGDGGFAIRAASLFQNVERDAERALEPEPLPALAPTPHWQWLLPAGLLATGFALIFLAGEF